MPSAKKSSCDRETNFADIVVTPYPSDHRTMVAEVELLTALAK